MLGCSQLNGNLRTLSSKKCVINGTDEFLPDNFLNGRVWMNSSYDNENVDKKLLIKKCEMFVRGVDQDYI